MRVYTRLVPVSGLTRSEMIRKVLAFGFVWVLVSTTAFAAKFTKESLETIRKRIEQKEAVILDVREEKEWKRGHLKAAKLLPLSALERGVSKEKLDELLPKNKVVYLHCAAGARCISAAEILEELGYTVLAVKPGYDDLLAAGFQEEK